VSAVRLAERLRSEVPANDNQLRAANDNRLAVVSFNTLRLRQGYGGQVGNPLVSASPSRRTSLSHRSDDLNGVSEFSCYDALNRLTQYAAGNGATACTSSQNHKVVAYDALGDITSKTSVSTYA
jgi:hypothetical protein